MNITRLIVFIMLCGACALIKAQDFDFNLDKGVTVESSYLQESVDLMLIREQSRSESRDLKLSALSNIEGAINRGVKSGEVLSALEYLALEGIVNKTAYRNRAAYPDVRSKAALYLGVLGGPEAKRVLLKMAYAEYETIVLTQVVAALKTIGISENDENNKSQESVDAITKILYHSDLFSPDNLLALSGLEAYETFAARNNWKLDLRSVFVISQISQGRYHGTVRLRAKALLTQMRTYQRESER
ncbi:MAG: HEAT repeat domain-containing protein [Spirochaetaceae bacterium]|jgi:hypothetical protein|nr:HEAT repeat domain-containing protein [Spirochaetaceae bacterium]